MSQAPSPKNVLSPEPSACSLPTHGKEKQDA